MVQKAGIKIKNEPGSSRRNSKVMEKVGDCIIPTYFVYVKLLLQGCHSLRLVFVKLVLL